MRCRLLDNPDRLRQKFRETFVLNYDAFCALHSGWMERYDEAHYAKMYLWDRFGPESRQISFAEALSFLKTRGGEVWFLTEDPECMAVDFCRLDKQKRYVAAASRAELAALTEYEWFTEYELAEQGRYLADPVLPSDFYVFDESFRWCLVFTHETDWDETPDSRVCFLAEK